MRIAVFLGSDGRPSPPHEAHSIAFYAKPGSAWELVERMPLRPLGEASAPQVTAFVEQLSRLVKDAKAVAGSSVAGVAYSVFNRLGKHIFEIATITSEQISGIAEDIALAESKQKLDAEAFQRVLPAETDIPGVYTMDLVTAQEEYPELSSKMILKPFLKSTPFTELSIICRHLPPWLMMEQGLTIAQKPRGDYLMITVSKTVRGEA